MDVLLRKTMVLAVLGALLAAGGCENNSSGVVIETQKRRGFLHSGFESEVTIRRADGTTTKLNHVGNPFYIISFVEVPSDNPAYVDPRIERLAKRFELDSVAVIQMSLPKAKEKFNDEAIAEATLHPIRLTNLSRFLDPERRAWGIFGRPELQSILVVDRRGVFGGIRARGTLDDPQRAIRSVRWMQKEWEIDQKEMDIEP